VRKQKRVIEIEVELYAFLRNYLPKGSMGGTCKMQLNQPMSATDVLKELKVPNEVIQTVMIIMINRVQAEMDQLLYDGDVLSVIPFAPGG
jgi:molybdopterin converting factor small subunit